MAATEGRIVLVTGAGRGLGKEVSRQCVVRGDTVLMGTRSAEVGAAAADDIMRGDVKGRAVPIVLDVTDYEALQDVARKVEAEFPRVDVVVNNAAIHYDTWEDSVNVDFGTVREALETNLLGAWQTSLAFLPLLRKSGHGRIVMVSSQGGSIASMRGGTPAYSVSKAGLNALTATLAGDLKNDGILVNAVCPGWTATEMGGAGGRPVPEGAASIMYAVDLPDAGPTGTFTRDGQTLPW